MFAVSQNRNYIIRTQRYNRIKIVDDTLWNSVDGRDWPNPWYWNDYINNKATTLLVNDAIFNGGPAPDDVGCFIASNVLRCKTMARNMAAFRLEGDGDGAIWHRVRSFYIGI